MVRRMCFRAAHGNIDTACDLVQDVAEYLLNLCDTFEPDTRGGNGRRWVAKVTLTAIDHSLRGAGVPLARLNDNIDLPEDNEGDLRETIAELSDHLDPADRELLQLRLAGYSNDEIALRKGLTHGAVRARMHRILQAMRHRATALGY